MEGCLFKGGKAVLERHFDFVVSETHPVLPLSASETNTTIIT